MRALFVVAVLLLLPGRVGAAVVYDQPHDGTGAVTQSSWNGSDYDKLYWDDFTLASDAVVTEVRCRGGYFIPPVYPSGAIVYFDLSFWDTIAGQPNIGAGPLVLHEQLAVNETPAGTFGGMDLYDYSFPLPAPFHATAGTHYWVEIGAFQPGVPGWGIASGSGGTGQHFESFVNYAGGTQYRFGTGDAAFMLLAAGGITSTTVPLPTTSTTTGPPSTTTTLPPRTTTTMVTSSTTTSTTVPRPGCSDVQALVEARARTEAECRCTDARNHGAYVRCARKVTRRRARDGALPRDCKVRANDCVARSTCGRKPGFVTCCLTRNGSTKCKVKRDAATCVAKGGCVGSYPSCCEACIASGCAPRAP